MEEIWRSIKDYEGLYEVSNWGRVRSLGMWANGKNGSKQWRNGRVLKFGVDKDGYLSVTLCKDGTVKHCRVHRLVGMAFPDLVDWTEEAKGRPFEELVINHKDQNPANNRVENLEWCTVIYNNNYMDRNERMSKTKTNGKTSKHVYQYTLDGQQVRVWPSLNECARNGFTCCRIWDCCHGKKKTHRGFRWSY